MPGSIIVSVLEVVDLPAAAEEGEFVSVKVSVGKTEFQTSTSKTDSGKTTPWNSNFSFPVLNLRDNLVVSVVGSKGEEISQTEVDTSSIVEKGFCDEFLSMKGGGSVHLRLSFILTEEERQRIEMMRAAALKRQERGFARSFSDNQSPQYIEEFGKWSTGSKRTMADSTAEKTRRANRECILAGVTGKTGEGTELKDPMAIEEISELSATPDSANLTPNSVKARVKALESSLSQDAGTFSQLFSSQGGNLEKQNSTELMKSNATRNVEEKEKASKKENEHLIHETSRKYAEDENMHLKEGKVIPGVSYPCSNKIENTDSDLLYKAATEQSKGREYYTLVRKGENKNVNSVGILDVAKQILSGAAMGAVVVTVAVLIWATAANSKRRRTSIAQKHQRKK